MNGPIPYRSQLQIYMLTTEAANYKDSKPKATEEITHCIHQLKVKLIVLPILIKTCSDNPGCNQRRGRSENARAWKLHHHADEQWLKLHFCRSIKFIAINLHCHLLFHFRLFLQLQSSWESDLLDYQKTLHSTWAQYEMRLIRKSWAALKSLI